MKLIGHNIRIAYERVIYKVTSILLSWSNHKGGLYSGIVMICFHRYVVHDICLHICRKTENIENGDAALGYFQCTCIHFVIVLQYANVLCTMTCESVHGNPRFLFFALK